MNREGAKIAKTDAKERTILFSSSRFLRALRAFAVVRIFLRCFVVNLNPNYFCHRKEFAMSILLTLAQAATTALPDLTGLGSAGVMGAMWLWERRTSRQREQQLDEAHARIQTDRVQLDQIITLVRQNTEALTRLCNAQERVLATMERGRAAA